MIGRALFTAGVCFGAALLALGCTANTAGDASETGELEEFGSVELSLGELVCVNQMPNATATSSKLLFKSTAAYGNTACPSQYIIDVPRQPANIRHQFQGPFFANKADIPVTAAACATARLSSDQFAMRQYSSAEWTARSCATTPANCPPRWMQGGFRKRMKGKWITNAAGQGVCEFVPDVGNLRNFQATYKSSSDPLIGPFRYTLSASVEGVTKPVQAGVFLQKAPQKKAAAQKQAADQQMKQAAATP